MIEGVSLCEDWLVIGWWEKPVMALALGVGLVGSSSFADLSGNRAAAGSRVTATPPASRLPLGASAAAARGSLIVIERLEPTRARIQWRSPWRGQSVVRYAATPRLLPDATQASRPTANRVVELQGLQPQTRYFFRVETATPHGLASSAVCSFRTK